MNCFDCADIDLTTPAVAVCADCGRALPRPRPGYSPMADPHRGDQPHGHCRTPGAGDPLPGVPGGPRGSSEPRAATAG